MTFPILSHRVVTDILTLYWNLPLADLKVLPVLLKVSLNSHFILSKSSFHTGKCRCRLQKHQLLQLHLDKCIWFVCVCACVHLSMLLWKHWKKFSQEQQMTEKKRRKRWNECWISPQINITSGCWWKTMWYIDKSTTSNVSSRKDYMFLCVKSYWKSSQTCVCVCLYTAKLHLTLY